MFSVLSSAIKARSAGGIRVRSMGGLERRGGRGGGFLTVVDALLIRFCLKSSSSYYIFYCRSDRVYVWCPLSRVSWRLSPKVEG